MGTVPGTADKTSIKGITACGLTSWRMLPEQLLHGWSPCLIKRKTESSLGFHQRLKGLTRKGCKQHRNIISEVSFTSCNFRCPRMISFSAFPSQLMEPRWHIRPPRKAAYTLDSYSKLFSKQLVQSYKTKPLTATFSQMNPKLAVN